jgi:hypothetical protein
MTVVTSKVTVYSACRLFYCELGTNIIGKHVSTSYGEKLAIDGYLDLKLNLGKVRFATGTSELYRVGVRGRL